MGYSTRASGEISTARGNTTVARGFCLHHLGPHNEGGIILQLWGHIQQHLETTLKLGNKTTASDYNSLVLGQWNLAGSTKQTALQV
ncbi:MAG: hypothetical protein CM15mP83_8250 [Flavobacteriaceae bacterium]|nr:MAG: hypothetical protein CM15mP83_8250 [Flavobacteriaceae bacterium]